MTIHRRHPIRADELVGWGSHLVTGVEAIREREMAPPLRCACGIWTSRWRAEGETCCLMCRNRNRRVMPDA